LSFSGADNPEYLNVKPDPVGFHEAEIMMEILRHGSQVEVLEPQRLREKVAAELVAATKNYGT
jgi:hypothetical protein